MKPTQLTLIVKGCAFTQVVKEPDGIYYFEDMRVKARFRRNGYCTELVKFAIILLGVIPEIDVHRCSTVAQRVVKRLGYRNVGASQRFHACDLWKFDRRRRMPEASSLVRANTIIYSGKRGRTEVVYLRLCRAKRHRR